MSDNTVMIKAKANNSSQKATSSPLFKKGDILFYDAVKKLREGAHNSVSLYSVLIKRIDRKTQCYVCWWGYGDNINFDSRSGNWSIRFESLESQAVLRDSPQGVWLRL